MTHQLDHLLLGVSDLPASVRFYRDQLGLALVEQHPELCRFEAGTVKLVLVSGLPDDHVPGYGAHFYLRVGALDKSFETIRARGGPPLSPTLGVDALEQPAIGPAGVREFVLRDPDGYLWHLCDQGVDEA